MQKTIQVDVNSFYIPLRFLKFMRKQFGKSKREYKLHKDGWTRHSYYNETSNFTWSYYLIRHQANIPSHPFLGKYNRNEETTQQPKSGYVAYIKIFGDKAAEIEKIILEEAKTQLK